MKQTQGISYIRWWGFSINEGGGPANIHMEWFNGTILFYVYIYAFGKRWWWKLLRKRKQVHHDDTTN